jgi:hypothetical protein
MRKFASSVVRQARKQLKRLRSRLRLNASVWRSWEQFTRAAALGAIGVSIFASGESVNPWSLASGIAFLLANAYIAWKAGEMEGKGG